MDLLVKRDDKIINIVQDDDVRDHDKVVKFAWKFQKYLKGLILEVHDKKIEDEN